jgi:adenylylsulfate kinase-like enzyme
MDDIRRKLFRNPTYSDEERDLAYRFFVLLGSIMANAGTSVLLDGTGHKKKWRDFARSEIPNFIEVYLKCPIEICIQRETDRIDSDGSHPREKLYLEALERLKSGDKLEGLGKMPGVDEPFEESESPEIILDSSHSKPDVLVQEALSKLATLAPEIFSSA